MEACRREGWRGAEQNTNWCRLALLAGRLAREGLLLSAGRLSRGRTDARTFCLAARPPRREASCPASALLDDEVVLVNSPR